MLFVLIAYMINDWRLLIFIAFVIPTVLMNFSMHLILESPAFVYLV